MAVRLRTTEALSAPDFTGVGPWINTEPLSIEDLIVRKNIRVIMVVFMTYTRASCVRAIPYLNDWWHKYHDMRFRLIGVIVPEFAFEKDWDYVEPIIEENKIEWPVVLDPDNTLRKAYGSTAWPDIYMIGRTAQVRYRFAGEGSFTDIEKAIQEMIKEADPLASLPGIREVTCTMEYFPTSPDIYCGYVRGRLGNPGGFRPDVIAEYEDPTMYEEGFLYLNGLWECRSESVRHARETHDLRDHIAFAYRGTEVNAVVGPAKQGDEIRVFVMVDGGPVPGRMAGKDLQLEHGWSWFAVTESKMYEIIRDEEYAVHALHFTCNSNGFEAYDFTVAGCKVLKTSD